MKEARIIKTDGTETVCRYNPKDLETLKDILDCTGFHAVKLRDGRLMIVDDEGALDGKPVNEKATKLYMDACIPALHPICGDVAIVIDSDFE